jgi:mutator protein MutT
MAQPMIEIALAVIIDESGPPAAAARVLVARRRKGAPRGGLWEFPGGKIEPGERPEAAAIRETLEETGCEIVVLSTLGTSEEIDPRETSEPAVRLHAFVARARRGGPAPRPLASEEIRWVGMEELRTLPMPGANRAIVEAFEAASRAGALVPDDGETRPTFEIEVPAAAIAARSTAGLRALGSVSLVTLLAFAARTGASPPKPIELPIGSTSLAIAYADGLHGLEANDEDESSAGAAPAAAPEQGFGAAGTWRLNLLGGVISDFSTATGGEFRSEFEYFLVDRLSLVPTFELGAMVQDGGDDPLLVSGALLLRWHFLEGEGWTVFADAGAGVAYLTGDLPPGTNGIKFNPQIGAGFTLEVSEGSASRLMGGVRWYHFSNARTGESNDGFDGAEAYLGLSIPF